MLLAESSVSARLICRKDRMWKKHGLVSAETCLLRDRVLSRVTPRIFMWGDIETAEPATSMLVREGSVSVRCLIPKMMVSDLSGLRARPLRQNQVWRWARHCSQHCSSNTRSVTKVFQRQLTTVCRHKSEINRDQRKFVIRLQDAFINTNKSNYIMSQESLGMFDL